MQPFDREIETMNGQQILNHYDPTSSHNDDDAFMEHMLSSLPPSWPDMTAGAGSTCHKPLPWDDHFDEQSAYLATKLRQHQINADVGLPAKSALMMQQQMLLASGLNRSPAGINGEPGMIPVPLSLTNGGGGGGSGDTFDRPQHDVVDACSMKLQGVDGSIQGLFNGFVGSFSSNQHFQNPQNYAAVNQSATFGGVVAGGGNAAAAAQPRQRVRARRGQATDPHSIAERLRRERIAERMKALQELVPNANKTDKASMLDEIIDYVKFLQLQVKVLSMSRLGGASAVAPLVPDVSSEGGGDGGGGRGSNGTSSSNEGMAVAEHQVIKLMEEDMGSAMQYLQGKGLCLMPISLATAISTVTTSLPARSNHHRLHNGNGISSSSPTSISALTAQSTTLAHGSGLT